MGRNAPRLAAVAAFLVILAACGGTTGTTSQTDVGVTSDSILLGNTIALSGAAAAYELVNEAPNPDPDIRQKANLAAGEMYDLLQKRDLAMKAYEAVLTGRADSGYPAAVDLMVGEDFGKARVLRQKAVAGMDRLRACRPGDFDDAIAAQITLTRRRRPETMRFVAGGYVKRADIGIPEYLYADTPDEMRKAVADRARELANELGVSRLRARA